VPDVTLILFHTPPRATDPPLTRLLGEARRTLAERHVALFRAAGVDRIVVAAGRGVLPATRPPAGRGILPADTRPPEDTVRAAAQPPAGATPATRSPAGVLPPPRPTRGTSFGEALAGLVRDEAIETCIVMGDGAVPRMRAAEAALLVATARAGGRTALTNNRYSSDVCAVGDASALRGIAPLPSDNALPRWLEEIAGFDVGELAGRDRLGLDIDSPLDLALLSLATRPPASMRALAAREGAEVPRLEELRAVAADPRRELLVFGRSSSRALAWLERHVRCRVRFLAEERGMRASSPLAIGEVAAGRAGAGEAGRSGRRPVGDAPLTGSGRTEAESIGYARMAGTRVGQTAAEGARGARISPGAAEPGTPDPARHPRATIGRLLDRDGPQALGSVVAGLADAAILDSRVLLADRLGADEADWPCAEDRFASDLLLADRVNDPWLRELTAAAASASVPILLGGHTLVGPGVPLLFPVRRRPGALR
jgi:hypothetical protein